VLTSDTRVRSTKLRDALDEGIRSARACGALHPLETQLEVIEDRGVRFLVRRACSLQRKEADKRLRLLVARNEQRPVSPFLPPEPELTIGQVSGTHLAVLNKFNVLEGHLLLVTRDFEHQENLLSIADFHALFTCMAQYDSLAFYNGGAAAGASQSHKHLQLVPLPLARDEPPLPIEPLLEGTGPRCAALPYRHSFRRLAGSIQRQPRKAAKEAFGFYLEMLIEQKIATRLLDGARRHCAPYNILIAHDWMLMVPRRKEAFRGISINALGFAGSLFVKDQEQLDLVRREGPVQILRDVSASD
jgi:ATP adenylyltransferase